MSQDPVEALLEALKASPDNQVLRAHVVRELLKSRRWEQAEELARPLQGGPSEPVALLAQARWALVQGKPARSRRLYEEALEADKSLVDEALEAELSPDQPLKLDLSDPADKGPPPEAEKDNKVNFNHIGGMETLKEQIRLNILYPMTRPEIYEAYGKKVGGGLMMYGPPGCGKTHIARATAGEMGANFYILSLNDVLSKWMGETEKAISGLFDTARATGPSVIFIDEVDALGAKRSDITSAPIRWTVSQFLVEMDGVAKNNEKVLVMGATNAPWNVDSALRRPGRFDRLLFVPPPDYESRIQILKIHTRGRKIDARLDWAELAKKTEHFSGADLSHLVERATERVLQEALKSGNLREVTLKDFQAVLSSCKPSTMEWLRRSRNYVNFANQDGIYDELAAYLDKARVR